MNEQLKKEVKMFQIIYAALIAFVFMFIFISLFLNISEAESVTENDAGFADILLIAALVFSIPSIIGGIYIFRKKTEQIELKDIGEKISIYRTAMIIRAATIEGPCFFFAVVYFTTASVLGLLGAVIGLMILIWFFPTLGRLSNELKHNFKELKYE